MGSRHRAAIGVTEENDAFAIVVSEESGRISIVEDGDQGTPLKVFTDDNVDETGTPPAAGTGYGDAYIAGYEALWGQP